MSEPGYRAFISYSHRDEKSAAWLHRALETYRPPAQLQLPQPFQPITPVFRDRDELRTAADLSTEIRRALDRSEYLIVLGSPHAAASKWVAQEIEYFQSLGRTEEIIYLLVGSGSIHEQLPSVALQRNSSAGTSAAEPLAADATAGGDGRRLALLKVVATLLDVPLAALVQRDQARRNRRLLQVAVASTVGMAMAVGLAVYALVQRSEANAQRDLAQYESATATEVADLLVGLFQISNPTVQRPDTITAITVLNRGAEQVQERLADRPEVRSRLLTSLGQAYYGLGEYSRSLELLELAEPLSRANSDDRGRVLVERGKALWRLNRFDEAAEFLESAVQLTSSVELTNELRGELSLTLGYIANFRSELQVAEQHFTDAVSLFVTQGQTQTENSVRALAGLAVAKGSLEKIDASRQLFLQALALQRQLSPGPHISTFRLLDNIGNLELRAGRLELALQAAHEARAGLETLLLEEHPDMANNRWLEGRALVAAGRPLEALEPLNEALSIYQRSFGEHTPLVAEVHYMLAQAYVKADKPQDGFAALASMVEIYKSGMLSAQTAGVIADLRAGYLNWLSGQDPAGARLCKSGLAGLPGLADLNREEKRDLAAECGASYPDLITNRDG